MTEVVDRVARSTVRLDLDEGALVARVELYPPVAGTQFAFYLQRDGKRIETRWYSDEPRARFAAPVGSSRYRVVGFVRRPDEAQAEMIVSAPMKRVQPRGRGLRLDGLKVHAVEVGAVGSVVRAGGKLRIDVTVPGLPFTYQCLMLRRPGDRLFVMLGGAVPDRTEVELPRFNRFSWAPDFPGSILCVADPTLLLGDRIRLGWYFGSADADATEGLCEVASAVASAIGLGRERIVSYGSSGGGFAAMQLAARLGDGATAIAINPQTDILRYAQKGSVREFLAVCTGGMRESIAREQLGHRLQLIKAWRTQASANARCLLVQNLRDRHHYNDHFLPFAAAFSTPVPGVSADGRIGTMTYEHPNGHGAEPRSMVPAILERAFELGAPSPTKIVPMNFLDKVASIKPKADFLALTYISLRNRYVYLAVGKAANSTVKHHLYELEYIGTRFKTKSVHDRQSAPLLSPFQLSDDLLEEVFTGPKYFRFSVVRNPYSRLLSCYLDRIVPCTGAAYRQLIRALGRPEGSTVSFPEFIRLACAQTPFAQNNHWRLQVAEICADVIPYDFIGKQETFAEDMTRIWTRIAPARPAPEFNKANKSPSITGAKSRLKEYYTAELAELVRRAYLADFERFDYPQELV